MAGGVAHITHRPSGWPRGQLAYPNSTHPLWTDQDPPTDNTYHRSLDAHL